MNKYAVRVLTSIYGLEQTSRKANLLSETEKAIPAGCRYTFVPCKSDHAWICICSELAGSILWKSIKKTPLLLYLTKLKSVALYEACTEYNLVAAEGRTHQPKHGQLEDNIKWIPSMKNQADLPTRSLPRAVHRDHSFHIGLRKLCTLRNSN